MFDKMTSIAQDIASKKDGSRESLGMRLREHSSLVRAGENDEKFHTVYEEEIAEFLPKIIARTAASSNNQIGVFFPPIPKPFEHYQRQSTWLKFPQFTVRLFVLHCSQFKVCQDI